MRLLDPTRRGALAAHLPHERPGPLVTPHVMETGQGACFVDRWPDPRVVVGEVAGNFDLSGDPTALDVAWVAERVSGLVAAEAAFVPSLRAALPELRVWGRVILELDEKPPVAKPAGAELRCLEAGDAWHLFGLGSDLNWIAKTLGGPVGTAASRRAWGAFVGGRLASVAVPFFIGRHYEDVGVVTEAEFRGRGLSPACAGRVAGDVRARGRRVSWSTSPDNEASLRVARKLGFREHRRDSLYVVGEPIPESARPADP